MKDTKTPSETPITNAAFEEYYASDRKLMDRSQLMKRVAALERVANGLAEALMDADDDIREYVQVARYNLTGEMHTGDKIAPPNPPLLIHAAGIGMSDKRRAKIREALAAFATLQPQPSVKPRTPDSTNPTTK